MGLPNIARLMSSLASSVMVVIVGCGPDERPPPEEEVTDLNELATRAASEVAHRSIADDCKPWSSRPCRIYWKEWNGQLHCPQSTQVCLPGGHGWFPCGLYQLDESGVPRIDGVKTTGPQADAGSD